MVVKKEIVYPVFLECSRYAVDSFWENVFDDLAYGKSPYGTYISKDFLCCKYKKKEFSYKIERKDSEILYKEVFDLLYNTLGLVSHKDKIKKRDAFILAENVLKESRKNWNDIKKKNIKDLLIELYVIDMKNKFSLTLVQTRYLASIIFTAIIFKVIGCKDIEYTDGRIDNIDGIDFVSKQIMVERDLYKLETSFSPEIILEKKLMSDSWEKYIKDFKEF